MTPASPSRRSKAERVVAIDAARGLAIVLVMLSHFAMRFATEAGRDGQLRWAVIVGMIASPTFVLLSGAVYGTLAHSPRIAGQRLRNLLFDRGLFLLVVAHPLLAGSALLRGVPGAWHRLYITDTIAAALILGPVIARRTKPQTRVVIGCGLVLVSWLILSLPVPTGSGIGLIVRELLVGTLEHGGNSWWGYHWPLAQWFGVYLIGTTIGASLAARPAERWQGSPAEWLLSRACVAVAAGAIINLAFLGLVRTGVASHGSTPILFALTSIESKFPPSPAYFLWFGGLGLSLIALMYARMPFRWHATLSRVAQPMGRSSLLLYVTSDYLFHVPFLVWHPRSLAWWLPTFVAILVPLYVLAKLWTRADGNRFLTVGYPYVGFSLRWRSLVSWMRTPPLPNSYTGRSR